MNVSFAQHALRQKDIEQPAFQPFREKALGWAMYNLVWLVENCEAAVAKQRKEKKASKVGTVAFPTPP